MIGFISTSFTRSLNHTYYSVVSYLHNLQFTVTHALGFSVFTSRLLATDLNTETSTWNHYAVFLSFLVQSPWNLRTQLKTPSITHSSILGLPANDLCCPFKPLARTYIKHVTWSLSIVVWHHCLSGSVFTEPLTRNGLHNPVVHVLLACIT
jgi:hypothetical protein